MANLRKRGAGGGGGGGVDLEKGGYDPPLTNYVLLVLLKR